jgi:aspartate aminotransferase-like enzyme
MLRLGPYVFKQAETAAEFEQIHALNYRTFVVEIPQHVHPGQERLVDKFHEKNAYFIVSCGDRVAGMVSCHDQPPFSVAARLADPALLERPGVRPVEVRLLALEPGRRRSTMFFGLLWTLYEYVTTRGYTHLFISGVENRVPLYRRLGFETLGPSVACGDAWFVPMVLAVGRLPPEVERTKQQWEKHLRREGTKSLGLTGPRDSARAERAGPEVCLLPGPVATAPGVEAAFQLPALYHRGPEFISVYQAVRRCLGDLVGGKEVALLNGSGTLANEAVAATLSASEADGRGVLLVNGEFGRRLAGQVLRFGLRPRVLEWAWGQPWNLDEVAEALAAEPPGSWVWGVHQESSTGVLNDLAGLVGRAQACGIRVCADCISSLGAVPLDLRCVHLATGATGKSLGAYAGAALVFADTAALRSIDTGRVPNYLDVAATLRAEGPRFTFPSQTLLALQAALSHYASAALARERYLYYAALGEYVRRQLRRLHLEPLAADQWASPVVTTFAPPHGETSAEFVARCRGWGFAIGGQSQYLAERRFVQIATMGAVRLEDCARFFDHLESWLAHRPAPRQPLAS